MKRIISFILALMMIFSLNISVMADAPIEATDNAEIVEEILEKKGAMARYVYAETVTQYKSDWGYHPQINSWQVVDGYNLAINDPTNMSVSISYGSLTIEIASADGSGSYFVAADRSRGASRVKIGGTVATDLYDAYIYDEMGVLQTIVPNARRVFNSEDSELNYYVVYRNS